MKSKPNRKFIYVDGKGSKILFFSVDSLM